MVFLMACKSLIAFPKFLRKDQMSTFDEIFSYCDANGLPLIKTSFCVFADILGLTSQIQSCTTPEQSLALCQTLHRLLSQHRKDLKDGPVGRYCQMFSDCLVLGYPFWDRSGIGETESSAVLDDVQRFQLDLALNGFFVRGGVAAGELHMSAEFVYGRALIEAYRIENCVADVPRLVLSKTAEGLVRHHLTFYAIPESSPQASSFLVDEDDGYFFVNYLEGANNSDYGTDLEVLEAHRKQVNRNLEQYSLDERIVAKYRWVRDYHNFFCQEFIRGTEEWQPSPGRVQSLLIAAHPVNCRRFRRLNKKDARRLPER